MADDAQKPKRGRGRPPKDPNDTETAPYTKRRYETAGKVGRPKKNPYEGSGWGGVREGQGRPKSVPESEKLSYNIAFSCNAVTKERYRRLQGACNISELMRGYINRLAATRLGTDNVPDNWKPPKK